MLQHVRNHDEQGESSARRVIETKLSLVVSIAERHSSSSKIEMLDLIEKGNGGLLTALDSFTGGSSESFATHAAYCIEQAILKFVAEARSRNETS